MNRLRALLVLELLLLAACGGGTGQADRPDTLTRRQRHSAIGASRLPGAQGVRGAQQAQDSVAARNARLDSLARQRP